MSVSTTREMHSFRLWGVEMREGRLLIACKRRSLKSLWRGAIESWEDMKSLGGNSLY